VTDSQPDTSHRVVEPDSFFVTQTVLELIDLPFYDFQEAGLHELKGDFLPERPLYRLSSVDHVAMAERPVDSMSAEDWFLKGVGLADLEGAIQPWQGSPSESGGLETRRERILWHPRSGI
jgi:hypothetical protein